jgi:hypothetical protein
MAAQLEVASLRLDMLTAVGRCTLEIKLTHNP